MKRISHPETSSASGDELARSEGACVMRVIPVWLGMCLLLVSFGFNSLLTCSEASAAEVSKGQIKEHIRVMYLNSHGDILKWSHPIRFRVVGEASASELTLIRQVMASAQRSTKYDIAEDLTPDHSQSNFIFILTRNILPFLRDTLLFQLLRQGEENPEHYVSRLRENFKRSPSITGTGSSPDAIIVNVQIYNLDLAKNDLRRWILQGVFRALTSATATSDVIEPSVSNKNPGKVSDFTPFDVALLGAFFSSAVTSGSSVNDVADRLAEEIQSRLK